MNSCKRFRLSTDELILLWRTPEGFYATETSCPHAGGILEIGKIKNGLLFCPWHGWKFQLTDGKCLTEPHAELKIYPILVKNEEIYVQLIQKEVL